jgi:hypothetical protein
MALRPRPALQRHDTALPTAWLGWPAPVGLTHARAKQRVSGGQRPSEETRGQMRVHVRTWVCGTARVCEHMGARRHRLAGRPNCGGTRNNTKHAETPRVLWRDGTRRAW